MTLRRLATLFVCCALASGGVCLATDADAFWWQRYNAATCQWDQSYPVPYVSVNGRISSSSGVELSCPIDYSTHHFSSLEEVNLVRVYGYDGHSTSDVYAQLCVSYWDANGVLCDTATHSTGTGTFYIDPTPSNYWWTGNYDYDFPYVYITLPSGYTSVIMGYYVDGY